MKANEFVKKFGLDLAKRDVRALESGFIKREDILEHYGFDILDDLKRLVESHELVQDLYGIERAKQYADSKYTAPEISVAIKQAITDVESCQ